MVIEQRIRHLTFIKKKFARKEGVASFEKKGDKISEEKCLESFAVAVSAVLSVAACSSTRTTSSAGKRGRTKGGAVGRQAGPPCSAGGIRMCPTLVVLWERGGKRNKLPHHGSL